MNRQSLGDANTANFPADDVLRFHAIGSIWRVRGNPAGFLGYFFLPFGNRSETETSRAWAKRRSSSSETQRTPASILASVPRLMSQPARWHLPASPSWDSPFAVLTLAICLPVTFVGKSSVLRFRNLTVMHRRCVIAPYSEQPHEEHS